HFVTKAMTVFTKKNADFIDSTFADADRHRTFVVVVKPSLRVFAKSVRLRLLSPLDRFCPVVLTLGDRRLLLGCELERRLRLGDRLCLALLLHNSRHIDDSLFDRLALESRRVECVALAHLSSDEQSDSVFQRLRLRRFILLLRFVRLLCSLRPLVVDRS